MLRMVRWILLLAAFSAAVVWLTRHPGNVDVVWLGYEIRVQVGVLIAAFALITLALLPVILLLRRLLGLPAWLRLRGMEREQAQGLSALTQAFTALAVSDLTLAERQTRHAQRLLGNGPLIALLAAQIAWKQKDQARTEDHLSEMLSFEETRFIAARALTSLARKDGRIEDAVLHAEEALAQDPRSLWTQRALFDLYLRAGRTQEAESLIRICRRRRRISAEDAGHLLAVFYTLQAEHAVSEGNPEAALRAAREAQRADPAFVPAALLYAQLAGKTGEKRKAIQAITRCFKETPHPELGEQLLDLCQNEPAAKLTKRAEALASAHPEHHESYLLRAAVAMYLYQWAEARMHLQSALALGEHARAYRMLASIEKEQYDNPKAAADWLTRASEAPPEPVWLCSECGHQHPQWVARCQHCDGFDSLTWSIPAEHREPQEASLLLT